MSLHWTLIAGFLYAEIGTVLLLMVPFISSRTWHAFFKSRFFRGLQSQMIYYFYFIASILLLFFLDAVREMWKYSDNEHKNVAQNSHLDAQMQNHMRLFRAQRNMYISGFAGFLCLVINWMVNTLSNNATLKAEKEAALKQAESATKAAEAMLKSNSGDDTTKQDKDATQTDEKSAGVKKLEDKVAELEAALQSANKNVEGMRCQSQSLAKEYDRLLEEKDKLEKKVNILKGENNDNKKEE
eukprot:TRINITY_DN2080_c0_g1_i3.p1 TRINITY_DN2080_c0_g1~~TRINITY_DN2080_c0_g1_i3.p1  ORF type:complete len:241 (+),score=44.52 TRINITY_DN2080_c0_g1_i3:60-782(+)